MTSAFRRLPCQLGRLASSRPIATSTSTSFCATWGSQRLLTRSTILTAIRPFSRSSILRRDVLSERPYSSNPKGLNPEEQEVRVKEKQVKRPWLREDADKPPADQDPEANINKKGRLLITPTRLLKLIIPLSICVEKDKEKNTKDYGRAILAELPPVVEDGKEKIPNIYFQAEDSVASENRPRTRKEARAKNEKDTPENPHSSSTEMGDFIHNAARGREFAIKVEGYNLEMRVSIEELAGIKHEYDNVAHCSAHRLDLVELVTYLVGLTIIIGGYLWFMYISRDLSYKAAINLVYEANGLCREIKTIAAEYDVNWYEMKDLLYLKRVKKVLEKEKEKRGTAWDDDEGDEEESDAEEERVKSEMRGGPYCP
ncbi:hypothetical protein F5883DRAFT_609962 [Diaporthe sp. PMI_573]|nr:hypothetical protein F5883DRAFT_609962 [Diaporthaceae sp. PMI_573]